MYTPGNLESGRRYEIPHPTRDFSFIEPVIMVSADRRSVIINWPTVNDELIMGIERFCAEANLALALSPPAVEQLTFVS